MSDDPAPKPRKTFTELAKEFPNDAGIRMMAGAEAEWKRNGGFGIFDRHLTPPPHPKPEAHSDHPSWVKLANDPKVPPRARQYYQELIDGDRRAQSDAGKHTADVVETVRRILAKLRR